MSDIKRYLAEDTERFTAEDVQLIIDLYGAEINPLLGAIAEFMERGGQLTDPSTIHTKKPKRISFGRTPTAPHRKRRRHWLAGKKDGEVGEFLDADFKNDLIEYIDGAIDVSYVAFGALLEAAGGSVMIADILVKEVMRSNATKLIECEVAPDGKIKKGPYYQAPRIKGILQHFSIDIPEQNALLKTEVGDRIAATNSAENG